MGSWSNGAKYSIDIVKTDLKGNLLWHKSKKGWDMFDMEVIDDTIYYCANRYDTGGKKDILFEAITSNGDSVFSRQYDFSNSKIGIYFEFEATEDNGFIFIGVRHIENFVNDDRLVAFKIDRYGKIVWEKQVEASKNMSEFRISGVDRIDKDEFLLKYYGYVSNDPNPIYTVGIDPIKKSFFTIIRGKDGKELSINEIWTDTLKETSMRLTPISKKRYFADLHLFSDTSLLGIKSGWANQTAILDSNFQYISKGSKFLQKFTMQAIKFKELKEIGRAHV